MKPGTGQKGFCGRCVWPAFGNFSCSITASWYWWAFQWWACVLHSCSYPTGLSSIYSSTRTAGKKAPFVSQQLQTELADSHYGTLDQQGLPRAMEYRSIAKDFRIEETSKNFQVGLTMVFVLGSCNYHPWMHTTCGRPLFSAAIDHRQARKRRGRAFTIGACQWCPGKEVWLG